MCCDLAAGDVRAVFSVDLFNEGVDVPAVDTVLMLRPTESPTLFLQQLGRGLRRAPGKGFCSQSSGPLGRPREAIFSSPLEFPRRAGQLIPFGQPTWLSQRLRTVWRHAGAGP
ncbi:MAG TPA: helicase-related protein [Nocardioides sp.]